MGGAATGGWNRHRGVEPPQRGWNRHRGVKPPQGVEPQQRAEELVPAGIGCGFEILYPDLALNGFIQGDHGVCGLDVGDFLDGIEKDLHKVIIVKAIELCKDGKAAGDEMALYNLWNLLKICNYLRVFGGFREGDAYECADIESQGLGLYQKTGAGDYAVGLQPLDSLVNSSTGDAAFTGNLKEGHTCILYQEGQDFLVYFINVVFCHNLHFLTNRHKNTNYFDFLPLPANFFVGPLSEIMA